MATQVKYYGSAFGALETSENLSAEQIDACARDLLSQLTLDEKIKMMCGDLSFWTGLYSMMVNGYAKNPWIAGAIERLGIPGIRFTDGPRGVMLEGSTTFPVSMGRGATFDPQLEERIGDVIGREARAMGANFFGGVCINLLRHPAWGRAQETYGEDPIHLGEFGAALTHGVQKHVMACAKHFALNSMENARFRVDVHIDPRPLHEIYLRHFKRAVDAGAASIMSAYNSMNGEWCGQNATLLTDILKKQWGFQGFVMTDFIWGMRDSKKAALAGQDVEMPFSMHHIQHLNGLVERGEVPAERIDDAALRVLRQQIRFAQGRNPQEYPLSVVGCEAHRQVAREAAEKAIVLLKNEGNTLPLKGVKKLAVIGRLANQPNTGDGGSSNTYPAYVITPLQGLQEAIGNTVEIVYDDGSDPTRAAQTARQSDAVVMVVGYTSLDEGEFVSGESMEELNVLYPAPSEAEKTLFESLMKGFQEVSSMPPGGDRKQLTLRMEDEALIQEVAKANSRVVVAMMGGSAILIEKWRSLVPAILMLWYPGMEGGRAFADILLGKVNPSGRLPCVFATSEADLPYYDMNATQITYDMWHGYRKLESDGAKPAFPFGFGLSYTTFRYDHLRVTSLGDRVIVELEASNTGATAGDTVVQCYVAVAGSRVERAPKELKAFQRVSLQAGETRHVRLEIPLQDLAYYDPQKGWVVEEADYTLIAGQHSLDDASLRAHFQIG